MCEWWAENEIKEAMEESGSKNSNTRVRAASKEDRPGGVGAERTAKRVYTLSLQRDILTYFARDVYVDPLYGEEELGAVEVAARGSEPQRGDAVSHGEVDVDVAALE